jgi:hypothetical protein
MLMKTLVMSDEAMKKISEKRLRDDLLSGLHD